MCGKRAVNMWICLDNVCLFVGCGVALSDHSSHHADVGLHLHTVDLLS